MSYQMKEPKIHKVVWEVCEEKLRNDERISGREVAKDARVHWSHTKVTPHINEWHEHQAKLKQELIKQTQMSSEFVNALLKEVDSCVTKLREVDNEQLSNIKSELNEMIELNAQLESELSTTKELLRIQTEKATLATTEAETANKDKARAEAEHHQAVDKLQRQLESEAAAYAQKTEQLIDRNDNEVQSLKIEHREEINKLSDKRDDLTVQLKDKTAECAEANVKAAQSEKLTEQLEAERDSVRTLSSENMRLTAELESKSQALDASSVTIVDNRTQRDKAQKETEQLRVKLDDVQSQLQVVMLEVAKAGIDINKVG